MRSTTSRSVAEVLEAGLVAPGGRAGLWQRAREMPASSKAARASGSVPARATTVHRRRAAAVAAQCDDEVASAALVARRHEVGMVAAQALVLEQSLAAVVRADTREHVIDQVLVADRAAGGAARTGNEGKGWHLVAQREQRLGGAGFGLGAVGGDHPGGVGVLLTRPLRRSPPPACAGPRCRRAMYRRGSPPSAATSRRSGAAVGSTRAGSRRSGCAPACSAPPARRGSRSGPPMRSPPR